MSRHNRERRQRDPEGLYCAKCGAKLATTPEYRAEIERSKADPRTAIVCPDCGLQEYAKEAAAGEHRTLYVPGAPGMPSIQNQLERAAFIFSSVEKIEAEYLRARRGGIEEPIVIMLDLRDPEARKVSVDLIGEDRTAEMIATGDRQGTRPITMFTTHADRVVELLPFFHGARNAVSMAIPPDHFRVIGVSGGANQVRVFPAPEMTWAEDEEIDA